MFKKTKFESKCASALYSLLAFVAVLVSLPANAEMMDRVLVIVNEDVITQSEFDYRMVTVLADLKNSNQQQPPPDLEKQLLDGMVADRLQIQEAQRRGITIGDQELEAAIRRFAAAQNLNLQQLVDQVTAQGQSYNRFKESVRESLIISRLTEYYARTRVVVPDYEIDGFIDQNDMSDAGAQYQIARIFIKNSAQNQIKASQILDELRDGGSFQQAVLNYSEATDAQDGGLMGWLSLNQLPDVYAEAIKGIKVGGVTDVLETANGLHILKLLDLKGDREEVLQSKVRHILIKSETQVAKAQAAKKLLDVRQRIIDGEDFSELARIYSEDSVSAATGGELGWVSPGDTVPPFENTFQQLPLNEVSMPVETQYGVHILEVLDRRQKNVTDQVIRNRVDNILRRQRAEREFEQWVRELREEAYVEYVAEPA